MGFSAEWFVEERPVDMGKEAYQLIIILYLLFFFFFSSEEHPYPHAPIL